MNSKLASKIGWICIILGLFILWALFIPTGVLLLILSAVLKGQEQARQEDAEEESELQRIRRQRREQDERIERQLAKARRAKAEQLMSQTRDRQPKMPSEKSAEAPKGSGGRTTYEL